jgi:hypothetical protein
MIHDTELSVGPPARAARASCSPHYAEREAERRAEARRETDGVPVLLSVITDGSGQTTEGWVLDCSRLGLALSSPRPFDAGMVLLVAPADAPTETAMVKVKYSQTEGSSWRVGCEFLSLVSGGFLTMIGLMPSADRR